MVDLQLHCCGTLKKYSHHRLTSVLVVCKLTHLPQHFPWLFQWEVQMPRSQSQPCESCCRWGALTVVQQVACSLLSCPGMTGNAEKMPWYMMACLSDQSRLAEQIVSMHALTPDVLVPHSRCPASLRLGLEKPTSCLSSERPLDLAQRT